MSAVSSFILYIPPAGKPDPHQPRDPGEVDTRRKIPQSPQKGETCDYYALNLIRQRYGKRPDPSFAEQRRLEHIASAYRKEFTRVGASLKVSLASQMLQQRTQAEVSDLVNSISARAYIEFGETALRFLQRFDVDPQPTYEAREHFPGRPSWRELDPCQRAYATQAIAFSVLYKNCYKLEESSWEPTQPVEALIQELAIHRMLLVKGAFGKDYYQSKPLPMKEKIHGRTLWYWPPNSPRSESLVEIHSIVLIGARKIAPNKAHVYFIDPEDGSHPGNREQQRIYVTSYENLKLRIRNLFNEQLLNQDGRPAFIPGFKYALRANRRDLDIRQDETSQKSIWVFAAMVILALGVCWTCYNPLPQPKT